ncbi:variable surface lipoprotein [Mycoplasmopsis agalactiae]
MKKINKFLTIFGAVAPISALPFIAAYCCKMWQYRFIIN